MENADWGDAVLNNTETLLNNAASHVNRELRQPVEGTLTVRLAPTSDFTPRTLVQLSTQDEFFIQLTAKGRLWAKFAYQFSHEFCHVLVDPYCQRSGPHRWFEEAICEMASVFVVRRMSERWITAPPYPNWADYASSLRAYANDLLSCTRSTLADDEDVSEWLHAEAESLRQHHLQRDKNAIVAYALLPLIELDPTGWNAIQRLPVTEVSIHTSWIGEYLRAWRSAVDPRDTHFVDQVRKTLGLL